MHTPGGDQPSSIINESGMWSLVLKSRKPEAKRFKKWVTSEVIPTIRKTGGYMTNDAKLQMIYNPDALLIIIETGRKMNRSRSVFSSEQGFKFHVASRVQATREIIPRLLKRWDSPPPGHHQTSFYPAFLPPEKSSLNLNDLNMDDLRVSKRSQARIRIALQGPSGAGKTYSSLLLAFGLTGDWSKVAVIDTENQSADLYAHLGQYNVISVGAPQTPEKYVEAIEVCEKAGMEAIIIDSISHEWETLLDIHSNMPGNSFSNWAKITPRHNSLLNKILSCSAHMIATVRTKQDYVLTDKNGKMVPEKVGMKGVQRDGLEYDFTLVFDVNIRHLASTSKDRTGMFVNLPDFMIGVETGKKILDWCMQGSTVSQKPDSLSLAEQFEKSLNFLDAIEACTSMDGLIKLFNENPNLQQMYREEFIAQKNRLLQHPNFRQNGTTAH